MTGRNPVAAVLVIVSVLGCNAADPITGDARTEDGNLAPTVDSDVGSGATDSTPVPPASEINLLSWKLTLPDASEIKELELSQGFESANEFYTDPSTGAMVFRCPNRAGSTGGSTYSRTELREMLRAGDTSIATTGMTRNNWVFSSSSASNQSAVGGVDGTLTATLSVDRVSETGETGKVGRVIVGQIHAPGNEPTRLYYRKLPGNTKGSIYFAHEAKSGEQWYELIGSRSSTAPDPSDGIALGERWGYVIRVVGDTLTVTITRADKPDVVQSVEISASGFAEEWMYYKAGVYNQNNTGDATDYVQASFYSLTNTHP